MIICLYNTVLYGNIFILVVKYKSKDVTNMADEKYIPQTQFSICKIDIGKVNDTFKQIKVVSKRY